MCSKDIFIPLDLPIKTFFIASIRLSTSWISKQRLYLNVFSHTRTLFLPSDFAFEPKQLLRGNSSETF